MSSRDDYDANSGMLEHFRSFSYQSDGRSLEYSKQM